MVRWVALICLFAACTRDNPEFELADGTRGDSSGSGAASISGANAGDSAPTSKTTDSGASSGAVLDTGDDDTQGVSTGETGMLDTGIGDADTGPQECASQVPMPIEIGIIDAAASVDPDCSVVYESSYGPITVTDGQIAVEPCGACPCTEGLESVVATVGGVPAIPALPECGRLFAWAEHDRDGKCRWIGLAVIEGQASGVPAFMALGTLSAPSELVNGFSIALESLDDCPSPSCTAAGTKVLGFSNNATVAVDEAPKEVEVPFGASISFVVDNLMSYIDEKCIEHVAWTAVAP